MGRIRSLERILVAIESRDVCVCVCVCVCLKKKNSLVLVKDGKQTLCRTIVIDIRPLQ